MKPICPICNEVVANNSYIIELWHKHIIGKYKVYYDNYGDLNVLKTVIYNEISLDGFVYLDEKRIEMILLLK
jgi:hypothetical protein